MLVYGLYTNNKDRPLDRSLLYFQEELDYTFIKKFKPFSHCHFRQNSVIIVRKSNVRSKKLEARHNNIYPSQSVRYLCRDKWYLYQFCKQEGILTPRTEKVANILGRYIFKAVRINQVRIENPLRKFNHEVLVQKRIPGISVKVYCNIFNNVCYGYDDDSGQKIEVPTQIFALSQAVIKKYNLLLGSTGWMVNEKNLAKPNLWYLIDVNSTTGLNLVIDDEAHQLVKPFLKHLIAKSQSPP